MNLGLLLLAAGLSFLVFGILALLFGKPMINWGVDVFVKRLLKDSYPENIGEMYNVFRKVGVQNVLETDLRSASGEVLRRPFGTSKHYSQWNQLLLNPVYLTRKPVVASVGIQTKVIIGPQAKKPLEIAIPIMIAGMAYGNGLSLKSKLALAKGADHEKTAINTGAGLYLPEERKHTERLIIQYHRGPWGKEEAWLRQANAIEIQLGNGALASTPPDGKLKKINDSEFTALIDYLRKLTGGVPIGVKIGATHYLERELEIITAAGIDFLTIDGKEAGINYGPGILADDVGLPTLPALCRAAYFLNSKGLKGKITLLISGGLSTPGQFLKALALGADAVYIGTVILIALTHTQITKVIPWEPLTQLIYEQGKLKDQLSVDRGSLSVANFLKSCNEEIILAMRCLGKTSFHELSVQDLCALTPEVSKMTGAELALFNPGKGNP
jgi:glutamate synthase domain-containing protein 2